MLSGSKFTLDLALPYSVLNFLIYRKSVKLFPFSKECCKNPGRISCLDIRRMEVKCPCEGEESAEVLCLCKVRAALV